MKEGARNPNWRGGRRKGGEKGQYIVAYAPDHPNAVQGGVLEHRLVVEHQLGRPLDRGEVIHHIDGNKHNNSPENLRVMSQSEHARLHDSLAGRRYRRPPVTVNLCCEWCGDWFVVTRTRDGSRRFCGKDHYMAYRRLTHHALAKGRPA